MDTALKAQTEQATMPLFRFALSIIIIHYTFYHPGIFYCEDNTMKAMVIQEYGAAEQFVEQEFPMPEIQPGHVIIKVAATSVNPLDTKIRAGLVQANPPFPAILHGDVAGIVTEVGEGVENLAVGDEVFGFAGGLKNYQGALADYMLADARLLAKSRIIWPLVKPPPCPWCLLPPGAR